MYLLWHPMVFFPQVLQGRAYAIKSPTDSGNPRLSWSTLQASFSVGLDSETGCVDPSRTTIYKSQIADVDFEFSRT